MYTVLQSSAAVGAAAARAMTLVVEVVVGMDVAAEAAAEAQVKADPQMNLRSTKSLGFHPISTTPQKSTRSSLQPRRHGFTSTAQNPPHPSAKLPLCHTVRTTPAGCQTMAGTFLVTTMMRVYCPSAPLGGT